MTSEPHLIILQHGYQGGSWDMQAIAGYLSVNFCDDFIYCARSNEKDSSTKGLDEMGHLLAKVTHFSTFKALGDDSRRKLIGSYLSTFRG